MFYFKQRLVAVLLILSFVLIPFSGVLALGQDDAFKAIVKIYTYYEDESYDLVLAQTGSGSIISSDGVILTNHHVVTVQDDFDSDLPTVFKVCLTEAVNEKPNCAFSANLISKEKERDIALLRIRKVGNLSSVDSFEYLSRSAVDGYRESDSVKALGYPAIGGETITVTSGTISGIIEKYSSTWIKTDTSFSFGSSGGALINTSGDLIGVTSRAYADMIDSLGYVIDINSINSWIDEKISNAPVSSLLQYRMDEIITKQNNLNDANIFENAKPYIKITKPEGWEFDYEEEGGVDLENIKDAGKGGVFNVSWDRENYDRATLLGTEIEAIKMIDDSFMTFISERDKVVSGVLGKEIVQSYQGTEVKQIVLPVKNYLVIITYFYGEDDIDRTDIDGIVNSIVVSATDLNYVEERSFSKDNPSIKLNVSEPWVLSPHNSTSYLLSGVNYVNPRTGFDLVINEISESVANTTNQEYFDYFKNNDASKEMSERFTGYTAERYDISVIYRINNEVSNAIKYKYRYIDEKENNEIKMYAANYRIREGDYVAIIEYNYLGSEEDIFEKGVVAFEKDVLSGLSVGRLVQPSTATSNNVASDGLSLPSKNITSAFAKKLIGKIILQVESNGEAWYLSPKTKMAYFLGRPADAFKIMRQEGIGIADVDLKKIPVGLTELTGIDSDEDGLSDIFEDAIHTNKHMKDTDGDGYSDKAEIEMGYNPLQVGVKANYDAIFGQAQLGRIFLQVQGNGEAWYVNPNDGKRYFLGRPADAFNVMRFLGLGISNADFNKIN